LHYAAEGEHLEVVKLLIANGANVNAICEPMIGTTPLAHVAQTCSLKMAELLLRAGASPTLSIGLSRNAIEAAKNRKRGEGPRVYELMCQYAGRVGK
jgi:ankyrin repeat protein